LPVNAIQYIAPPLLGAAGHAMPAIGSARGDGEGS